MKLKSDSVLMFGSLFFTGFLFLSGCAEQSPEVPSNYWQKVGSDGQLVAQQDPHDCVFDRRTGLMWEVKQADSGLHDREDTFSWYSSDAVAHMTEPGRRDGGQCGQRPCDTEAYVERFNQAGLCGFNDWFLPTREQLMTINDRARTELGQVLDPDFFPDAPAVEFWSSSTFRLYPLSAWAVDTRHGLDRADLKETAKAVRLVRRAGTDYGGASQ